MKTIDKLRSNARRAKRMGGEEFQSAVAGPVARATGGFPGGSLLVSQDRLSPNEQHDLADLCRRGSDGKQLSRREVRRWEALVGKASQHEDEGYFDGLREAAEMKAKIGELARRAVKPGPRRMWAEEGSGVPSR